MADTVKSPLRRAKLSVSIWLDILPKDARLDAAVALDKFLDLAEREIEQAFFAGQDLNRDCRRAAEFAHKADETTSAVA